jgi:hypothetical protein
VTRSGRTVPPPPPPPARALYPALPNPRAPLRGGLPRQGGSARGISTQGGRFRIALNELKRGLPFTTPTRLELINTRSRFKIPIPIGTQRPPAFLFHPCRSISSLVVMNPSMAHDLNTMVRSTDGSTTPWLWDWSGDEVRSPDGATVLPITDAQFGAGEAIGRPSSLVSPLTRVTGGVLTMRITCGPGTTGYLAFSCPALSELTASTSSLSSLYTAHATNPRIRRFELIQGTQTHHFIAPITNAPALEHFSYANDRFTWGTEDPYGATLFTFHDIHYNTNLGVAPVIELYVTVGLQCRLEVDDRHLATNHATSSKDNKVRQGNGDGTAHIGTSKNGHDEHVQSTLKADSKSFPGYY